MNKEIITFDDIEVEKHKFRHRKNLILLEDVYTEKVQVSKMIFSGKNMINILLVTKMMTIKLNYCA